MKAHADTPNTHTAVPIADPLLRTPEAARYLDMSAAFLAKARRFGRGPGFIKIGNKSVRYRRSSLDAYLNAQVVG